MEVKRYTGKYYARKKEGVKGTAYYAKRQTLQFVGDNHISHRIYLHTSFSNWDITIEEFEEEWMEVPNPYDKKGTVPFSLFDDD